MTRPRSANDPKGTEESPGNVARSGYSKPIEPARPTPPTDDSAHELALDAAPSTVSAAQPPLAAHDPAPPDPPMTGTDLLLAQRGSSGITVEQIDELLDRALAVVPAPPLHDTSRSAVYQWLREVQDGMASRREQRWLARQVAQVMFDERSTANWVERTREMVAHRAEAEHEKRAAPTGLSGRPAAPLGDRRGFESTTTCGSNSVDNPASNPPRSETCSAPSSSSKPSASPMAECRSMALSPARAPPNGSSASHSGTLTGTTSRARPEMSAPLSPRTTPGS
jgi:hypothetical protein